jgi:hypothetical protein
MKPDVNITRLFCFVADNLLIINENRYCDENYDGATLTVMATLGPFKDVIYKYATFMYTQH